MTKNPIELYLHARDVQGKKNRKDKKIKAEVAAFMDTVHRTNYVKNWTWMGRPILQLPTDMFQMQELIWDIHPDFIIETGIAHGGSTVFYASILHAIGRGMVLTIDNDIRPHSKEALLSHPVSRHLDWFMGSSIDEEYFLAIKERLRYPSKVMVVLDSNHVHDHVLQELNLYAPLVSVGSYIVVFDTSIEWLDPKYIPKDRPWGKGNSPWTAVQAFLKTDMGRNFVVDKDIEDRILLTSAVDGWLRRVK